MSLFNKQIRTEMKGKTLFKIFIAIVAVITVVSCIEPVNPSFDRTEASELSELSEYIDTLQQRGYDVDTTDLGVYYVVTQASDGPYPVEGDTCVLKYVGFLVSNGAVFGNSYSNTVDSTMTYIMGDTQVIPGWIDGMKVVNEGSIVYLIIPSSLAYGSNGNNYNIGPYEALVFRIDMLDIKQAN